MAPISKIGIIGAGQMGSGIAHVVALSGYDVVHARHRQGAGRAALGHHRQEPRPPGRIRQDQRGRAAARRSPASPMPRPSQALGDADLVIEAATEDETVKRKIFVALCPFIKPDAIVATNTSSISITRLAAVDRPARALHRAAFHEPGAGDGAGRDDPRHRHRGRHLRPRQGVRRDASARPSPSRRTSRPSWSTASCCR